MLCAYTVTVIELVLCVNLLQQYSIYYIFPADLLDRTRYSVKNGEVTK